MHRCTGGADHELEDSGFVSKLSRGVVPIPQGDMVMRQREGNGLLFPCLERDTLEASQLLERPLLLATGLHIKLDDLNPSYMAGIGDVCRHCYGFPGFETIAFDTNIFIAKNRVAP